MTTRTGGLALAAACALLTVGLTSGCSGGDVSTAAIPTTAAGPRICAMLSRADVATVFGTDEFTVDRSPPLDREPDGRLTGGGCVLEGDGFRLVLAIGIKLGDARSEAEKSLSTTGFNSLPGLRRFSATEGLGGVYRDRDAGTSVAGALLRGDYEIDITTLTGIPEERDGLADARALILQASNSLGIPLEPGSPWPTPTP